MVQEYNNVMFYKNRINGYWERSRGVPRKMHVYVWESINGVIPDGYCLHHIDFNKDNNTIENLRIMAIKDHAILHNNLILAREKAKDWHRSDSGKEWHKLHGSDTARNWKIKDYICAYCGNIFSVKSPRNDYRFCSNACRSAWRRESGIDNETRKCAKCGREFEINKYSTTICCSRSCASKLRWDKKHKKSS